MYIREEVHCCQQLLPGKSWKDSGKVPRIIWRHPRFDRMSILWILAVAFIRIIRIIHEQCYVHEFGQIAECLSCVGVAFVAGVRVTDRFDYELYDRRLHREQKRVEGAAVGRPCQRESGERGYAIAQGNRGDIILLR